MIRQANPEDAAAVSRLLDTSIVGTGPNDAEWVRNQLACTTALVLVAIEQNHVVGTIVGQVVLDEAEIHDVAVDDRYRRQGRATALVRAFEDHAERHGALQSFLEVRASNGPARHLYEAAGYGARGHRSGYYSNGEDAVVMSKALAANP